MTFIDCELTSLSVILTMKYTLTFHRFKVKNFLTSKLWGCFVNALMDIHNIGKAASVIKVADLFIFLSCNLA